jgi:uncharacterized membrane protein
MNQSIKSPSKPKEEETSHKSSRIERITSHFKSYNYIGLVTALLFFVLSMLPSLMPRPWPLQALLSGISIAIGYGIGVFLAAAIRWMFEWEPPTRIKRPAWLGLILVTPFVTIIYLSLGAIWQNEVRRLVGIEQDAGIYAVPILIVSLVIGIGLIGLGRSIRRLRRYIHNHYDRLLPRRVSLGLALLTTAALIFWVSSGVFFNFFVTTSNRIFNYRNQETPAGFEQPSSTYRSGSSDSLISWETIGRQGRRFVAGGGSTEQISEFSGQPALDPIRIYVGVEAADTPEARAELAIDEMKRTDAFDRSYIVLTNPTGTGWIEAGSINPVEFITNGDVALVAQQYSYLPSWISFIVDQQNAKDAGQALYEAVYEEWIQIPEAERPKLITYGLSLGSFGGQAAFSGINDMRRSVDGALFQGTPNDTAVWRDLTDQRDPGSPEWQPVYRDGRHVRFAATNEDILRDQSDWQRPRLLFMQHASDPIVWFSFDTILRKPDWLRETRGPDVSPTVRWYPFVTFFQLAIDQMIGNSPPAGHGHQYANTAINAWVATLGLEPLEQDRAAELQGLVDSLKD